MEELFRKARQASRNILGMSAQQRNDAILAVASELEAGASGLLEANSRDLAAMDPASPLYDRLKLTPERIAGIAADMRNVAGLPDPLDRILDDRTLPNGLRLRKKACRSE